MPLDWTLINGKQVGDELSVKYTYYAHPNAEPVEVNGVLTLDKKTRRKWVLSNGHGFAKKTLLKHITNFLNQ